MQNVESELEKGFEILRGCCGVPGALDYFFLQAKKYFCFEGQVCGREVLILGSAFPEELLMAYHIRPHWVVGGGLAISECADSLVPRDADAVSRSALGYIKTYQEKTERKPPVIIPIAGDSQRKLSYLLEEDGWTVYPLYIMPGASSASLSFSIAGQLDEIMEKLSLRWLLPGTTRGIQRAVQKTSRAKDAFFELCNDPVIRLNGMVRHFLNLTWFYAEDLEEWTERITILRDSLRETQLPSAREYPGVLVIGSPILFPNFKVPQLLDACGLEVVNCCSWVTGKTCPPEWTGNVSIFNRQEALQQLAAVSFKHESSGAFVRNRDLYDQALRQLDGGKVRGVILHILKGQIEYDFEADRLEQLFTHRNIPVLRLETDYHDNDIEQLRIRLEAFSELLKQSIHEM
ncbi:MAG: 2-hydroxyacyl-CoA dehydratase family protein [Lachnospiraceae bacterium]|nr:2-hydroxyacyl-CoA dehydratase family protein [Lachnospiraceae bacterium]